MINQGVILGNDEEYIDLKAGHWDGEVGGYNVSKNMCNERT